MYTSLDTKLLKFTPIVSVKSLFVLVNSLLKPTPTSLESLKSSGKYYFVGDANSMTGILS